MTTATLNPNRTFTIQAPAGHVQYVATYSIERFDSWLAFYRNMAKKYGHRTETYAADVAALEAIEPEVRKALAEVAG